MLETITRPATSTSLPRPGELARLLRPQQWIKNVFVLAPYLFCENVLDLSLAGRALVALCSFCLVSSAVYVFNDLLDAPADRRHPRKRHRPIAAGTVRPAEALTTGLLLVAGAFAVGALLPIPFLLVLTLYVINSLVYCSWLKHKVLVDVMIIAVGFVLRLLGGCAAIGVEPSSWLVVCGFSLALVLGFGKRRAEVAHFGTDAGTRPSLVYYNPSKLDTLLAINVAVCLLSYILYTVSPDTVARHNSTKLVYSVPLVAYGLFRYLLNAQDGKGDGPTDILVRDPVFLLTGALWVGSIVTIVYVLPRLPS